MNLDRILPTLSLSLQICSVKVWVGCPSGLPKLGHHLISPSPILLQSLANFHCNIPRVLHFLPSSPAPSLLTGRLRCLLMMLLPSAPPPAGPSPRGIQQPLKNATGNGHFQFKSFQQLLPSQGKVQSPVLGLPGWT